MTASEFEQLDTKLSEGGAEAAFERLIEQLREAHKYHELFDARLMQARHRLGLPVILTAGLDDLAEPLRSQVEEAYLEACKEVGALLLAERKVREAWMYLRPVGENAQTAEVLERIEADEENVEELIEVALQEGVSPVHGFKLVLEHFGTCSAITTFDSEMSRRSRQQREQAVGLLVKHLHRELLANLRAEIRKQEGAEPIEATIEGLVAERDWLFLNNNYHIDTTHLASVVRFARLIVDPEAVRLALDLTHYGRRLDSQFQFAGEEPFMDVYPHHGLYFEGVLGTRADEALAYFRKRAEESDLQDDGPQAVEVYIALLTRLGRHEEAMDAMIRLLPPGIRTSGLAPTLLELSRFAGDYERLIETCRARGDLLGYTAGLVERDRAGIQVERTK